MSARNRNVQQANSTELLPLRPRIVPFLRRDQQSARLDGQRFHGARTRFVFHKGMGHVPTDVAPDVRSRSYRIEAGDEGVLIAHGDMTSGYSLFLRDGHLVHDLNIGGTHAVVVSDRPVEPGHHQLGVAVRPGPDGRRIVLLINGVPAGETTTPLGFRTLISWSGLDIGLDRGSPVGEYMSPFAFTGLLRKVTVTMNDDQTLDGVAVGEAEMARQ